MTQFLLLVLFGAVVWLIIRLRNTVARLDDLASRHEGLDYELRRLRRAATPPAEPAPSVPPPLPTSPVPPAVPPPPPTSAEPPRAVPMAPPPVLAEPAARPPIEPQPVSFREQISPIPVARPAQPREPSFNWEEFLGKKMSIWVGGLALFLAVAFFVKYSFEKNLITPPMRVGIGYLVGMGLIVGGLFVPRQRYAVAVHGLCATGTLILYAITFAAHA